MVIQHNMMASNANSNLKRLARDNSKCIEKLSSGYRINRAGDDAAGLVISENMRGQIRALNRSSQNAQDGISLLQTADGAMEEVHSILQRMNELCVQGANDTNTSTDRQAIQKEIEELTEAVDDISENTVFNTKKLLDGTCSGSGMIPSEKDKFISWLNGTWFKDAATKIENTTGWTLQPGATLDVKFQDITDNYVATMSGSYLGSEMTITFNTDFLSGNLTYNGSDGPTIGGMATDRVLTHEMMHGYMFNNVSYTAKPDNWFVEGLAEAVHGASDIRYSAYEEGLMTNYSYMNSDIQDFGFAANEGGERTYSVGYLATSYLYQQVESVVSGSFKTMLGEMGQSDESFKDLVAKYTNASSYDDFIAQFKSDSQTHFTNGTYDTGFLQGECGIDIKDGLADALLGADATSSGIIPNSGTEVDPVSSVTTLTIGSSTVTVNWSPEGSGNGLQIQLGGREGDSMSISIDEVSSVALGINSISVSNHHSSEESISKCKSAIDSVSKIRSKIGAFQNRLEHSVSNIDNMAENLQSAESKIRDNDVAKTMVEYAKNNILTQVAESVLTQANKSSENVLTLLQ